MIFFVILELILIAARVTVSFFEAVPVAAQTALTWACVVVGIIAFAFVGIRIYKEIKGKK